MTSSESSAPRPRRTGCLVVGIVLLIALALALTGAGLWWKTRMDSLVSQDAILWMFPPPETDTPDSDPESPLPSSPAEDLNPIEAAREEAEIELRLLRENLAAAKEALEQAVVMVRESKENFDFAADRHEKLMPLVETGALEPLAASQIQSAYISARASYATAKFLLAQARQEYGSLEARQYRWELASGKLQKLTRRLDPQTHSSVEDSPANPAGTNPDTDPSTEDLGEQIILFENEPTPACLIEAWFDARMTEKIRPGMSASISLPGNPNPPLEATVREVSPDAGLSTAGTLRVLLESSESPALPGQRQVWTCRVTIAPLHLEDAPPAPWDEADSPENEAPLPRTGTP